MKPMIPLKEDGMTDGQTDKATDLFRSVLRKHQGEFGQDAVQQALGVKDFGRDLFAVFRTYVERFSNLIIRFVKVDWSRTPQQALDATGRTQYTNSSVVATMPKGDGKETEVVFFRVGRNISDDDLEKEYESRRLNPADPYSLAAVNEADPAFADEHLNGTHWKDADGKWCFAIFNRWHGERHVVVHRHVDAWNDLWWFGGVRKVVPQT